jgi:WW domain-containing oxidoreductase
MKEEINTHFPDKSVIIESMSLDLASFQSTKEFTIAFKEKQLPLHILINNAGLESSSSTRENSREDGNYGL